MSLTLYQLDGCPYCEKVADRLDELGIESTASGRALHSKRDEVKRVSGQRGVPVLVDDDRVVTMAESDRILEFETTYEPLRGPRSGSERPRGRLGN
ncbi:NrdH-redoxin [Halogeometricum sp. wsp3]|nr:NrdH-redoxin [Halogeometricum sp. wsp3]